MGIWDMISGSGPVVAGVLLCLLFLSLLCWTIILVKVYQLRRVALENERFLSLFDSEPGLDRLRSEAVAMQDRSVAASVCMAALDLLAGIKRKRARVKAGHLVEMLDREMASVQRLEMKDLEFAVPVLATTGNAAPFIGLFGTVWGIMKSFHGIGLKGSASLATVAPGISEALVATAAGLAAAIPAVIAYNLFTTRLQRMHQEMESFRETVLNRLELAWLIQTSTAGKEPAVGPVNHDGHGARGV